MLCSEDCATQTHRFFKDGLLTPRLFLSDFGNLAGSFPIPLRSAAAAMTWCIDSTTILTEAFFALDIFPPYKENGVMKQV